MSCRRRIVITESAVAGTRRGSPRASQPAFTGPDPSTSLAGSRLTATSVLDSPTGRGSAMPMPATLGSRFSSSICSATATCAASACMVTTTGSTPTRSAALVTLLTYTADGPSASKRMIANRGAAPTRAASSDARTASSSRSWPASVFPSRSSADMSYGSAEPCRDIRHGGRFEGGRLPLESGQLGGRGLAQRGILGKQRQVDPHIEDGAPYRCRRQLRGHPGVAHRVAVADRRDAAGEAERLARNAGGAHRYLGRLHDRAAHRPCAGGALLIGFARQATSAHERLVGIRVPLR